MKAIRTLGLVGFGRFGSFFAERAIEADPQLGVYFYEKKTAGQTESDLERVLQCDAVVFTVEPATYVATLREYVPRMRKDGIIVDVCTAKMITIDALKELADGRPYIATHPNFGRQSFIDHGNSLKGLQLVICEYTIDEQMFRQLRKFLTEKLELDIMQVSAEEHDRQQAEKQLLTQYHGCCMQKAGFSLEPSGVCTVSSALFYRAMEIVKYDEQLFLQVSKLNPFWPEVLARYELGRAKHNLETLNEK